MGVGVSVVAGVVVVAVVVVHWVPTYSFRGAAFALARAFPIRITFIFAFVFASKVLHHRPPKKVEGCLAERGGRGAVGVPHLRDDFGESRVGYPKIN